MSNKSQQISTEFQQFCSNIGQSFLVGSAVGIPCYFYHGYRYAPKASKFKSGWQLAKTRGVLLGTNFLVWRMTFEGLNYLLKSYRGKDDVLNWAGSGAFVGWILSVRAGPKLGLQWAVVYSALYQGQYLFNQELAKLSKQIQFQKIKQMKNMQDMNDFADEIDYLCGEILKDLFLDLNIAFQNIFKVLIENKNQFNSFSSKLSNEQTKYMFLITLKTNADTFDQIDQCS